MNRRLQFAKICGALAVLAALSFAPSAALAHAGHAHHPSPAVSASHSIQQATVQIADTCDVAVENAVQSQIELKAADAGAGTFGFGNCGNGCCGNVPCTTCVGLLAPPMVSGGFAADSGLRLELADAPASNGLGPKGIRRPPRSFV